MFQLDFLKNQSLCEQTVYMVVTFHTLSSHLITLPDQFTLFCRRAKVSHKALTGAMEVGVYEKGESYCWSN